jgi:hypothetical protein
LADSVVRPVLYQHRENILLWRFHRRAARDTAGHQFSFLFYSTPETAEQIYRLLASNRQLQEMKTSGLIVKDIYADTAIVNRPNIEDTSDSKWSPEMQKSWPHFIMGVSQMWLDLINQLTREFSHESARDSLTQSVSLYHQVNDKITQLWQKEGGHALLHHLSAVFGYEQVMVYEKRFMTF